MTSYIQRWIIEVPDFNYYFRGLIKLRLLVHGKRRISCDFLSRHKSLIPI